MYASGLFTHIDGHVGEDINLVWSILPLMWWLEFESRLGGNCWSAMVRNGRCTELLSQKVSKEECCASNSVATAWSVEDMDAGTLFFWRVLGGGNSVATAWSVEDMDAGTLFFWRVLGGGVPCYACKGGRAVAESCAGVHCGEGKKCVVRKGRPKCVCSPDCRGKNRHKGPVCGTDGRSYRTICRLRKRACRKKTSTLAIAYYGHCQECTENLEEKYHCVGFVATGSCDRIHCPTGKHCLLDQNLTPHCVKCSQRCPSVAATGGTKMVCGTDDTTYQSACHLREAACHKGKAIPVAYKGRCKRKPQVEGRRHQHHPAVDCVWYSLIDLSFTT
uniref:Follistatin n=1 Tax=Timema bartmani TaxID=61472 RepID=A0A7R9F298_9NEOP|nr:unnamed protein product [Timema bartmani]